MSPAYTCLHCGITATLVLGQRFCANCRQPLAPDGHIAAPSLPSSVLTTQSAVPYKSGHGSAQRAVIWQVVGVVLNLISIISVFLEIGLLFSIGDGMTISTVDLEANDSRQALIKNGHILVYAVTVVFFLLWIHRAYRNLPALGAAGLKFSPRWAVGGFFVPFLNLVRPFQVMGEIWQASSAAADPRSDTDWKDVPIPVLLRVWWGSWLLGNFLSQTATLAARGDHLYQLILSDLLSIAALVLNIVAAVLLIRIVRTVDLKQEEKRRRIVYLLSPAAFVPSASFPQPMPDI